MLSFSLPLASEADSGMIPRPSEDGGERRGGKVRPVSPLARPKPNQPKLENPRESSDGTEDLGNILISQKEMKMDCQTKNKSLKNLMNQKGETYGFSSDDYQSFVRAYSEISYAMAHNDFSFASLFHVVREQLGKQNFAKLLSNGLRLSVSEISDLNRKLSAFDRIPSQTIWNTIGYRGIQKIMSMPSNDRDSLLRKLSEKGENLTVKDFYSFYGRQNGRNSDQKSDRKSDWKSESKKGRKQDRQSQNSRSGETITLTRSDLENIVRRSIENVLGSRKSQKQSGSAKKGKCPSKMNQIKLQAMIV